VRLHSLHTTFAIRPHNGFPVFNIYHQPPAAVLSVAESPSYPLLFGIVAIFCMFCSRRQYFSKNMNIFYKQLCTQVKQSAKIRHENRKHKE
jgi:hypothetical protein